MTRIAVAAPNAACVDAGVDVAATGGNTVDAAIAATLVAMVTEPGVVSLSAGGYVTVTDGPGKPVLTIDGGIEMPGRDRPADWFGGACREVTTGYGGGVSMIVGHGSVGTPGALSALEFLHRRAGGLPWAQVVAPALVAARDGFRVGSAARHYLSFVHESVYGWQPQSFAALHEDDGTLLATTTALELPELAESLMLIGELGTSAFYTGPLADLIVADMDAHRGLLGRADLAAYRPVPRPALTVARKEWTVTTNPAPAIGGVAVAAMLELLDGHPGPRWTKADLARLVDVQEAVLGYRVRSFQAAPDRIAAAARLLELVRADDLGAIGSPSTAHVSVAGDDGVACAVTVSAGYGSGVLTPGTGIWQNNCLGELELNHGGLHTLSPGDRLLSNMAPTVAAHPDGAVLAIGSPGADRISTALAQVLAAHLHGGYSLTEAIDHPRLHVRVSADGTRVDAESDLDLPELPDLPAPVSVFAPHSMYFGGVAAASWHPDRGLQAAADPRRAGATRISD